MITKLEEFSNRAAATALGMSVESLKTGNSAIDIATITAIIQAIGQIVAMFQNCPTPPKAATIANPTWVQKIQFRLLARSVVSESGNPRLRGMSAKIADACCVEAAKLTEAEVSQILDETDAITNYLI